MRFSKNEQSELLEDDVRGQCFEKQITYMSIFYVVFSVIDAIILFIGDFMKKGMFICTNGVFLLPRDDFGCGYLFVDVIILFAFSYNISHIFFKIPDQHGLLVKRIQADSHDQLSLKMTFNTRQRSGIKNEFGETLIEQTQVQITHESGAAQINTEEAESNDQDGKKKEPKSRTDLMVAQLQQLEDAQQEEQIRIQSARVQNRANSFGALNQIPLSASPKNNFSPMGSPGFALLSPNDMDHLKQNRAISMNKVIGSNPQINRMSPQNLGIQLLSETTGGGNRYDSMKEPDEEFE